MFARCGALRWAGRLKASRPLCTLTLSSLQTRLDAEPPPACAPLMHHRRYSCSAHRVARHHHTATTNSNHTPRIKCYPPPPHATLTPALAALPQDSNDALRRFRLPARCSRLYPRVARDGLLRVGTACKKAPSEPPHLYRGPSPHRGGLCSHTRMPREDSKPPPSCPPLPQAPPPPNLSR